VHDDEAVIDEALVRRLLASQHPAYADLPLDPVVEVGTDNAMYRLGDDLAVRLPRIPSAGLQAEKEQAWLPLVAAALPLPAPVPVAYGVPQDEYPYLWSVCPWLPGRAETVGPESAAADLAAFVRALWEVDPTGGPGPGDHNFGRGRPLAHRDARLREALAELDGVMDTAPMAALWEECLDAPAWDGEPRWVHGDLHGGNVLVDGGRVTGVIDWGGLGVGDPATDVMLAWTYLPASARQAFRDAVGADDAMWARGRGWALSVGAIAMPYYLERAPRIAALSRRYVEESLAG
jgi:aminoglycoside phosphotransferase (APT) family kinase protein